MPELNMQTEAERTPHGVGAVYDRVFYTLNSKIYYSAAFGFVQERFHTNGRGVKEQRLFGRERGPDGKHRLVSEAKDIPADLPTVPVAALVTIRNRWGETDAGLMCNGKREGVWVHTSDKKLEGYTYTVETPYEADVRQGVAVGRYPDGRISHTVRYVNDKENGVRMLYHPNGAVAGRLDIRDNKVHGARYLWHDNGMPRLRVWHKDGEMLGNCLSWSYYGTHLDKSEYNGKGRQIGMGYTYHVDRRKEEDRLTLASQYDHGDGTPGEGKWVLLPESNRPREKEAEPRRGDKDFFRQLRRMFEFGRMARELLHSGRDKAAVTQAPARKAEMQTPDGP